MTSHHDGSENNYNHFVSPVSALSPGHNEYSDRDAHAPELALDSSPTAVTNLEAEYKSQYLETRDAEHPPIPNDDTAKEVLHFDESAKIVVPSELDSHGQYPQTATSTNQFVARDTATVGDHADQRSAAGGSPAPPPPLKKILGMNRKAFFILLAVLVIIAAAVGGGVGGAVASTKSKSDNASPATTGASSSTSTSAVSTSTTSRATSSTTRSSAPKPTFLNNQTGPATNSFAFQGFSQNDYLGNATAIIRDEGGTDFDIDIRSYVWMPNVTSCCLSFCNNATAAGMTGWWCDKRYQKNSTNTFTRIFVWCSGPRDNAHAKCV
ncbi:Uncharacterized protein TPAR_08757 [Tolypocladium paradoxum]|uniref:Uncharacterized protein n=1 Tax=Tolypocladium paradoxum TaxID=94208 RepID=A0A2S4KLP7_9HYPO|nr:Uncharacterized protein TPAR_08757 [Tolypocladium paradoxum]